MRGKFPDAADTGMPQSFALKLTPGADRNAVIASVRMLPGVATVVDRACFARSAVERLLHGYAPCHT
ncbi:hypothetical protein [Nonomuraea sp. NPDC049725]|uniref:hypothetical protein n=1 Tax=Nonomuraea sp. NPDC049725 TaxID=3154508 RepID=UPI0034330C3B